MATVTSPSASPGAALTMSSLSASGSAGIPGSAVPGSQLPEFTNKDNVKTAAEATRFFLEERQIHYADAIRRAKELNDEHLRGDTLPAAEVVQVFKKLRVADEEYYRQVEKLQKDSKVADYLTGKAKQDLEKQCEAKGKKIRRAYLHQLIGVLGELEVMRAAARPSVDDNSLRQTMRATGKLTKPELAQIASLYSTGFSRPSEPGVPPAWSKLHKRLHDDKRPCDLEGIDLTQMGIPEKQQGLIDRLIQIEVAVEASSEGTIGVDQYMGRVMQVAGYRQVYNALPTNLRLLLTPPPAGTLSDQEFVPSTVLLALRSILLESTRKSARQIGESAVRAVIAKISKLGLAALEEARKLGRSLSSVAAAFLLPVKDVLATVPEELRSDISRVAMAHLIHRIYPEVIKGMADWLSEGEGVSSKLKEVLRQQPADARVLEINPGASFELFAEAFEAFLSKEGECLVLCVP